VLVSLVAPTQLSWASPFPPSGFDDAPPSKAPLPPLPVTLAPVTAPTPPEPAPSPWRPGLLAVVAVGLVSLLAAGAKARWRGGQPDHTVAPPPLRPAPVRRSCASKDMALIEGPSPFCIGRNEVTVREAGGHASATVHAPDGGLRGMDRLCNANREGRGEYPVNCIDWHAARAWCRAHGGDLPTEDQWLRAAQGAHPDALFPWGTEAPSARRLNACGRECQRAWQGTHALYDDDDGAPETAPVGTFALGDSFPGLHDLAGNVAEWVLGPGDRPVARGSHWLTQRIEDVNLTERAEYDGSTRAPTVGFRCVTPHRRSEP